MSLKTQLSRYCSIIDYYEEYSILCFYKGKELTFSMAKQYDDEIVDKYFKCIDALINLDVIFSTSDYCIDKYCNCNDKMCGLYYNIETMTLYYKYKKYEYCEIFDIYYELLLLKYGEVFVEEDGSYLCRFGAYTFCFNNETCNINEMCEETLKLFFEIISQMIGDVSYFNDVYSPLHLLFHDGVQTYRGFELLNFDYISSRFNGLDI